MEKNLAETKRRANLSLIGAILLIASVFGTYTTLSVYIGDMMGKYSCGLTEITLIFSIASFTGILANFIVSAVIDKLPIKVILGAGTIMTALFFVFAGFSDSLILLYIGAGLFGLATNFAGFSTTQTIVSWWHAKNFGKKISYLSMAMAIMGVVLGLILPRILVSSGLKNTILLQGGAITVIMLIASFFLVSDKPEKYGLKAYQAEELPESSAQGAATQTVPGLTFSDCLKTKQFWILAIVNAIAMIGCGWTNNISVIFQSKGLDSITAGTMMSVYSACGIAVTFIFGAITDKIGGIKSTKLFIMLTAVAFAFGGVLAGMPGVIALAILAPVFNSYSGMINALTVGPVFGYKAFGKLLPIFNVAASVGVIIGPVLASSMHEGSGSFNSFFFALIGCTAVVYLLYIFLTSKKSVKQMQEKF